MTAEAFLDGRVTLHVGDVREELAKLQTASVDCVVTSPPYWGLRDYGVEGQIGLEPTLGEHLDVLSTVFQEIWRVLKQQGTVWLNYGDCYATAPNGRAAADVVGDDRSFRDKPFSTIGPIYQSGHSLSRGTRGDEWRTKEPMPPPGRVVAGGYLKPKDLCMIPNRLAIRLQEDGWWVRSEIIWHKPNPMPESVYDRPTTAHEKVFLLTKGKSYFYNHERIREPVTGGTHARKAGPNSRQNVDRVPRSRKVGVGPRSAQDDDAFQKSKASFHGSTTDLVETRNARNVWTISPKPFREAHFATFPPELARRCILAGTPLTVCSACGSAEPCGGICEMFGRQPGKVLDPFGGAGTVGLVASELGLDSVLIELNQDYAEIARKRINGTTENFDEEAA
jgi:DNA modification methylase